MQDKQFYFLAKPWHLLLEMAPVLLLMATFGLPPWWPYWPWALAGVGLCLVPLWQILRAPQIEGLIWLQGDRFRLRLRGEFECVARLQKAFVHPHLLALRFRGDDGRCYRLLVLASRAEAERYRHLRVILLHQCVRSAAQASPFASPYPAVGRPALDNPVNNAARATLGAPGHKQ